MTEFIEKLILLQDLLLRVEPLTSDEEARVLELRTGIPQPILDHFDRLIAHGKKGVANVRHGVCCECHIKLCSGVAAALAHPEDIHICDNCGRYLHLVPESAPVEEPPKKPARKPRRTPAVAKQKAATNPV